MLHNLTDLGDVTYWEKVVRTVCVYGGLLILLRVAGKRTLAQITAFDLVVLLLLSNVVQNAVIGNETSLTGGLFGAAVLIVGNYFLVRATYLHERVTRLLQGKEATLVEDGTLDQGQMQRQLITRAELEAALRRQGMGGIEDVATVKIEPEGTFTAIPKPKPGEPSLTELAAALARIEERLGGLAR